MFIFLDKTNLPDSLVISNLLCAVSFLCFLVCTYSEMFSVFRC